MPRTRDPWPSPMSERPEVHPSFGVGPRPESFQQFRMAQLLLALVSAKDLKKDLDLERLAIVEFLAANPFLVLDSESEEAERLRLKGFGRHSIAYASPGQRYISRRERLMGDVARLVAFGTAQVSVRRGRRIVSPTELGVRGSVGLCSVYADAYRDSSRAVIAIVSKLSDTALHSQLQVWLRADPVLFHLLDVSAAGDIADVAMLRTNSLLF